MSDRSITALVSGASAGIGAEFCRQLAQRCDAIIAVARRQDRLNELVGQLAGESEVHTVVADLCTEEGISRSIEALRQLGPVHYLVNNAGFSTYGPFSEVPIDRQQDMVDLHIRATLRLCGAAIPFMREAGGGAIINVSSLSAFLPAAKVAVYGATKAFLNAYSTSLQEELRGSGIRVQALCPGYTRTEIHETPDFTGFDRDRVPQAMWMDADEVVRHSLAALEHERVVVVPGRANSEYAREGLQAQVAALQ